LANYYQLNKEERKKNCIVVGYVCRREKDVLKWDIIVIQEGSSFIGAGELEKKCHNLSLENKKGMAM
jgi:hypothetical protein